MRQQSTSYAEDDALWSAYKDRLRAYKDYPITNSQFEWAELIFKQARQIMSELGLKLPPMQATANCDPDNRYDGECDDELVIDWNSRHASMMSFDVHKSGIITWFYMDYRTQKHNWGEWDIADCNTIPCEALDFLRLINGEEEE